MTGLRLMTAVLSVVFSLLLVNRFGTHTAGEVFAGLAAVELSAMVGRLGVPTTMTRVRRQSRGEVPMDGALIAFCAAMAAVLGFVLGLPSGEPTIVAVSAAGVAANTGIGWWHRGASRFLVATAAHPLAPLSVTTAGVLLGSDEVLLNYAAGVVATTVLLLCLARNETAWRTPGLLTVPARYLATWRIGLAELGGQVALLGIPIALVGGGMASTAAVFSLVLRSYRPLQLVQFAIGLTAGPTLADDPASQLSPHQRALLTRVTGLLQLVTVAYCASAPSVLWLVGRGLFVERELPFLLETWAVLVAGYAAITLTGPTGQLLLMRHHDAKAMAATLTGTLCSLLFFLLPFEPWLRAAGSLSVGLCVSSAATAFAAWRATGWRADPGMARRVLDTELGRIR